MLAVVLSYLVSVCVVIVVVDNGSLRNVIGRSRSNADFDLIIGSSRHDEAVGSDLLEDRRRELLPK